MRTAIKFCGLTRPEDVAYAAELGAAYVGVIFAGGPRTRTVDQAAALFGVRARAGEPERVGVFGRVASAEIARTAAAAALDVVQLHAADAAATVAEVRSATTCTVWAVVRADGAGIPRGAMEVAAVADGVVLDAFVPGRLGGTGVALPWDALAESMPSWRREDVPLVLAGGLTPDNVDRAIAALHPDVVDVSSGVESAPGIKDHARMRAFAEAVADAVANAR